MPRIHRNYDSGFRQEAVDLLLSSGRPLQRVAAELGVSPNQVVLAWLMADGIIPIVGVSTPAQLDDAIVASRLQLDADVRQRLDAPR